MFRRRRDDFWDWGDTVVGLASVMFFLFAFTFLAAAHVAAQSGPEYANIQRQIDRLQVELDRLDAQFQTERAETMRARLDGFSRLAAVERESELNRLIVFGTAGGFLGQALLAALGLRRLGRIEKAVNGVREG